MFKLLLVVIVLVVPIICRIMNERPYNANVVKRSKRSHSRSHSLYSSYEDIEQCMNFNDANITSESYHRITQEVQSCLDSAINFRKYAADVDTLFSSFPTFNTSLSDQQNSALIGTIQKYCPSTTTYFNCYDKLLPFFNACLTDDELKYRSLQAEVLQHTFNFLCENNSERATKFINEKLFDCVRSTVHSKQYAECFRWISSDLLTPLATNEPCTPIKNFKNCLIPLIEQCNLSDAVLLVKSLYKYVKPEKCDEFDTSD